MFAIKECLRSFLKSELLVCRHSQVTSLPLPPPPHTHIHGKISKNSFAIYSFNINIYLSISVCPKYQVNSSNKIHASLDVNHTLCNKNHITTMQATMMNWLPSSKKRSYLNHVCNHCRQTRIQRRHIHHLNAKSMQQARIPLTTKVTQWVRKKHINHFL